MLGIVLAGLIASPASGQTPPIFNPGAPGSASRVITSNEAVDLSRTTFIEADVGFMQHMIVHHAQAVEMVELLRTRGASATVLLLGERIASSQAAEIDIMHDWLTSRGRPATMQGLHGGHEGHGSGDVALMSGMLSPNRMKVLAAATGADFDRLFLAGMIEHHQGAIDMVDTLNALPDAAEDPVLSDFATSVVADQSAEILRMQSVLSEL